MVAEPMMAEPLIVAPGGWVLRADVPDGIFTLAIEADDKVAVAEHAAFADRCLPILRRAAGDDQARAAELRDETIAALAALRREVAASGLGYLGALAGERGSEPPDDLNPDNSKRHASAQDARPTLILLGIAATPMEFPVGIDPASLLAALLRHQYPGADVEEFDTASGTGAGMRRCESGPGPFGVEGRELPGLERIDTGIAQALVPFPEAGLLATVTALCFDPTDVDVAAVFTATTACRLRVVRRTPA